jgi:hypothetical protein
MAFSNAFSNAFAGSGGSGGTTETGSVSVGLAIDVFDPAIFDTSAGWVASLAAVEIGGVDVSSRLHGRIKIDAEEDAARIATLAVVPASVSELDSFDSADIVIDITLTRGAVQGTIRRFTGMVESVEFDPVSRIASLSCRDGYQERAKACASAADVEALFDGLAWPNEKIVPWNTDVPDPAGYFASLRDTVSGATFIDSRGLWRVVPWTIDTPLATLGTNDIFDDSLKVQRPSRADLPMAIRATMTHRLPRLHEAEVALSWTRPNRDLYITKGIGVLDQATLMTALKGLSGWHIKGEISITHPAPPYSYPVIVGGSTVYYQISYDAAQVTVDAFTATAMRRWYQEVSYRYVVDIAMGGSSSRDDSVATSIASTFDSSAWESSAPTEETIPIFSGNIPAGLPTKTGYEGLLAPLPPSNSAIDHLADLTITDVENAVKHTLAKAVRRAAAGKRKQRIPFSRPLDPRWEIGDVLAINAYGVSATGQIVAFSETIDDDTGECIGEYTLACPDGNGTTTGFSTTVTLPTPAVTHALTAATMTTHIGGDLTDTPASPDPETLFGWLTNTLPTSTHYDAAAPTYETQFRVSVPEIPAVERDPLSVDVAVTATINIAGTGITLAAF